MTSGLNPQSWHSPSNAHAYRLYVVKELAPEGSRCFQRRPRFCHVFFDRVKRLVFALFAALAAFTVCLSTFPGGSVNQRACQCKGILARQASTLSKKFMTAALRSLRPADVCPAPGTELLTLSVVAQQIRNAPSGHVSQDVECGAEVRRAPPLGGRRLPRCPGVDPSIVWSRYAVFVA